MSLAFMRIIRYMYGKSALISVATVYTVLKSHNILCIMNSSLADTEIVYWLIHMLQLIGSWAAVTCVFVRLM